MTTGAVVKPLRWQECNFHGIFTVYRAGGYSIAQWDSNNFKLGGIKGKPVLHFSSLAAAKAEAQDDHNERVQSLLDAPVDLQSAPPEGWKIVPAVPSTEMLEAAERYRMFTRYPTDTDVYFTMLDAAPKPPAPQVTDRQKVLLEALSIALQVCDNLIAVMDGNVGSSSDVQFIQAVKSKTNTARAALAGGEA